MSEQENNIIELIDENGEAVQFEHLATLEHEGKYYIALMLLDDEHSVEDDEGEVVIMEIVQDGEEETYVMVEDEDLQETVFEKFLALMEEAEDDGEE